MSIILASVYPGRVNPATGAYPQGEVRNETVLGSGDGTPYDEVWFRDISGFFQKIILDAGITPSGVADTALVSDYLTGLQSILESRLARGAREGCQAVRDGLQELTTLPGSARTADDSAQMFLAASLQKTINVAWTEGGGGNGGTPSTLLPLTNQMYRRFLVAKPDGTADICFDTSASAATFFADATAIAAGFTDATLYRRLSYIPINAGLSIEPFSNSLSDWRVHYWGDSVNVAVPAPVNSASARLAVDMSAAIPPSCMGAAYAEMTANLVTSGDNARVSITTEGQVDRDPSGGILTLTITQRNSSQDSDLVSETIYGAWETNPTQQIFYRWWDSKGTTGVTAYSALVFRVSGWTDPGIVA